MSASVLAHIHSPSSSSAPLTIGAQGRVKTFSWDADPKWATGDEDSFYIRKVDGDLYVFDAENNEVDELENHAVYGTGDSVLIQYMLEDGRAFAQRARVIGYAGCENNLYVETHPGFAVWVSPETDNEATWISGKPQILRHEENTDLTLDVDHERVIRRLIQFSEEAPDHAALVRDVFYRSLTWICYRKIGETKFRVAPYIITAHHTPTRGTGGLIIPAFAPLKANMTKPEGVRARKAMERLYRYGKKGTGPWNDRGRREVMAFASQYNLRLRKDFQVFQGHRPLNVV